MLKFTVKAFNKDYKSTGNVHYHFKMLGSIRHFRLQQGFIKKTG